MPDENIPFPTSWYVTSSPSVRAIWRPPSTSGISSTIVNNTGINPEETPMPVITPDNLPPSIHHMCAAARNGSISFPAYTYPFPVWKRKALSENGKFYEIYFLGGYDNFIALYEPYIGFIVDIPFPNVNVQRSSGQIIKGNGPKIAYLNKWMAWMHNEVKDPLKVYAAQRAHKSFFPNDVFQRL